MGSIEPPKTVVVMRLAFGCTARGIQPTYASTELGDGFNRLAGNVSTEGARPQGVAGALQLLQRGVHRGAALRHAARIRHASKGLLRLPQMGIRREQMG